MVQLPNMNIDMFQHNTQYHFDQDDRRLWYYESIIELPETWHEYQYSCGVDIDMCETKINMN